ncbi:TolC family protein [Flavicella sediminum]|uniref:TolC family protein n=1 Tax=Flavicella sediminum TaxID=2585141 RepID=UPI00111E991C|nr:efflux transporter outer membrane subunit [Flavicella sediminum]
MNNIDIRKICLVGVVALLMLNSCVPTKTIRKANTVVPTRYDNQRIDSVNTVMMSWKDYFSDEKLIALIDSALVKNQELNIMSQQLNIAKNEIQAKKGEYLPFVNVYTGADVDKVGAYTRNGAVEKNLNVYENEAFPEPLANYTLGLSASWELDIWKKLRNGKKAAVLDYLGTVEGKNFMITNLVSEIANTYYELIALDNQLLMIEQNLKIQIKAQKMVHLQKEYARVTQLAVRRFDAEVLKNQSNIYEVRQKIVEAENKINFLLGRYPQHVQRDSDNFIEKVIDPVAAGIPSQLLANRTDIRQAELELAMLKLNTKIAKANFYPSIGLKAGVGLEVFKPKYLLNVPESLLYSLGGDIAGPLINRRAIKADYFSANNRQLQAVFDYEKTILNAFIEVTNELSNIENLRRNYDLKAKQVAALTESIDLSMRLFRSARAEYTEVLLTQREALDSKIEIIETKKEQLLANVKVYKALGGGWK